MRATAIPGDLPLLLGDVPGWYVAAGWALSLHAGRALRSHEDLDVAVVRPAVSAVRAQLAEWELWPGLGDGKFLERPLEKNEPLPTNVLWCRPGPGTPWAFELLITDVTERDWVFKRDARVTRPLSDIAYVTPEGIPYLRPEIVLLHKAGRMAERDLSDYAEIEPALDPTASAWLRDALLVAHPEHPWLGSPSKGAVHRARQLDPSACPTSSSAAGAARLPMSARPNAPSSRW